MDIQLLLWLQNLRTPFGDGLMLAITCLGEQTALLIAVCALYWCADKHSALYMAFNFMLGACVNQCLKLCFRVERPWIRDARVQPVKAALEAATGYSFPSGHTAAATAFFGSLAHLRRDGTRILCWVAVLLVGFSRLYLGVHTPQDVLVSLVIGALLLPLTGRLLAWTNARPKRDLCIAAACLPVSALPLLLAWSSGGGEMAQDAFKTAGGIVGLALGWLCERRLVRFETRAPAAAQAWKLLGGVTLALALFSGAKAPLNALLGASWGGYVRYALVMLFILVGWPWLFTRVLCRASTPQDGTT